MSVPAMAWYVMARPPMVTLPLVVTDSGLKGSNRRPSAFSASVSALGSGDFGASGVAPSAVPAASAASVMSTVSGDPQFDRLMSRSLELAETEVAQV